MSRPRSKHTKSRNRQKQSYAHLEPLQRGQEIAIEIKNLKEIAENGDKKALIQLYHLANYSTTALAHVWEKQNELVEKFSVTCQEWPIPWADVPLFDGALNEYKKALRVGSDLDSLIHPKAYHSKPKENELVAKAISADLLQLLEINWRFLTLKEACGEQEVAWRELQKTAYEFQISRILEHLSSKYGMNRVLDQKTADELFESLRDIASLKPKNVKTWCDLVGRLFRALTDNQPERLKVLRPLGEYKSKRARDPLKDAAYRRDGIVQKIKDAARVLMVPSAARFSPTESS